MSQPRQAKIIITAEDQVAQGASKAQRTLSSLQQRADEESFRARQTSLRGGGDDFLAEAERIARDHQKLSARLEAERQSALKAVGDDPGARAQIEEAAAARQLAADQEQASAQQALLKADAAAKAAIEKEAADQRLAIQKKEEAEELAAQEKAEAKRRAALRSSREAQAADIKSAQDRAIAREAEAAEKTAQVIRGRGRRRGSGGGGSGRGGGGAGDDEEDGPGGIRGLRQKFGARSDLGIIAQTLAGAGAVAGVAIGANLLADMVGGITKIREGLAAGTMTATDLRDAFEHSIPIVGRLAAEVDELFTGDRAKEKSRKLGNALVTELSASTRAAREAAFEANLRGTDKQRAALKGQLESELGAAGRSFEERSKDLNDDDRLNARVAFQSQVRSIRKKFDAESIELERQANAAEEREDAAHGDRLAGLYAELDTARLQDQGRVLDAEITMVKRRHEAALAAIDAEEKAKNEADPSRGSENGLRAQQLRAENEVAEQEELQRTRENFQHREKEELRAHVLTVADIQTQALQQELTFAGKTYQAQLESLRAAKAKELETVQHDLDEKLRLYEKDADQTHAIRERQRAEESRAAIERKYNALGASGGEAERFRLEDRAQDIRSRLNAITVEGLQQEATAGDAAARREAEKLQITEQYRQKREALIKLLKTEKDLTEEQKRAIGQSLGGLAQQEAVAQRLAEIHADDPGLKPPPGLRVSRFGDAGFDDRFQRRDNNLKDVAKNTKDGVDVMREIAGYLSNLSYSRPDLIPLFTY